MIDSGFCVSRDIFELERKSDYGASLIKKKKYWPKVVPGASIDAHFESRMLIIVICLRHQLMT